MNLTTSIFYYSGCAMIALVLTALIIPYVTLIHGASQRRDWEYLIQIVVVTLLIASALIYTINQVTK